MNSWLKRLVNTRTRLALLFKVPVIDVVAMNTTNAIVAELKAQQNMRKVTRDDTVSPLVKEAARLLRQYPLTYFEEQLGRSNNYVAALLDQNASSGQIKHKDTSSCYIAVFNPPSCSCGYFEYMGLPCRHYLCLATALGQSSIPSLSSMRVGLQRRKKTFLQLHLPPAMKDLQVCHPRMP